LTDLFAWASYRVESLGSTSPKVGSVSATLDAPPGTTPFDIFHYLRKLIIAHNGDEVEVAITNWGYELNKPVC